VSAGLSPEPVSLLVAEDDAEMLALLQEYLQAEGYAVTAVSSGGEAVARLRAESFDVVVTDLCMPDMDGMEVLRACREIQPDARVILVTAFGSIETAIRAIREGAFDYATKPFRLEEIGLLVARAAEDHRLRAENLRLQQELLRQYRLDNLLGKSPAMQALFALIRQAAKSDASVLILGESGTGKELVARALHYNSVRAKRPFVPVNCAAVPAGLLESELFGHLKGAFTGAVATRRGLMREAAGGTLFLDEIGDMAPELQAKLLRAIEDKAVRPVGSDEAVAVDVRVVSATNRDLGTQVREGQFREDLYYRLAVLPIQIPPLRERREDIPLLAEHFLRQAASATGREALGFAPETMAALLRHPWPGNVRELENVVQRAVALTVTDRLQPDVLLLDLGALAQSPADRLGRMGSRPTLESLAQEYIALVLREVGGDKTRAAEILGISRRTLYRRENKLPADDTTSQTETS